MKLLKYIIILLCCYCTSLHCFASRAYPRCINVIQSDGSKLTLHRFGDELLHGFRTTDGIIVCADKNQQWCYATISQNNIVPSGIIAHNPEARTLTESLQADLFHKKITRHFQYPIMQKGSFASNSSASVKAKGSPIIPIVLIQFRDVKFLAECDSLFFDKHFNACNYQQNGYYGSVRDYFIAQSDSIFQPQFRILGVVTLHGVRKDYGGNIYGNDRNDRGMMQEALDSLLARNIDFSPYVSTNNRIPAIGFIYAGPGEQAYGPEESIWAKCYTNFSYTFGKHTVEAILCVNESADYDDSGTERPDGIGTFVHEFSHAMGLPDFYSTDNLPDNFGLDFWDIMDWGQYVEDSRRPVGYSSYERIFMGWLQPATLEVKKQNVELSPLTGKEGIRAIMIPNEANKNEYLLLENRTASTWFSPYYGEGMLVYHVDYSSSAWIANTVNNVATHQRMSILCADNTPTPYMTYKNKTYVYATKEDYQGDFYPGLTNNTEISDTSTPAATAFTGNFFHRSLTNIKHLDNGNITFVYMDDGIEGIRTVINTQDNQVVTVYSLNGEQLGKCNIRDIRNRFGKGVYIVKHSHEAEAAKIRIY